MEKKTITQKSAKAQKTAGAEMKGKILKGIVVSDKMQKTIVVEVNNFVKNAKYQKFVKVTRRFKAHDEANKHKVGETVSIQECRPMSRDKSFVVLN